VLGAHARAVACHPRAYLATLASALKMSRPGAKGALWQLFYFAEAIVLWRHCTKVDARHVHAHHASPPADVAALAASFGKHAEVGPSTWSMTMHGPTEFWNTRWYRLPEKIRHADGVICISDFARSQVMALVEEEHWSKLRVVHCGLVCGRYSDVVADVPARRQILSVGRLVPDKGQAVLVHALASLQQRGHDLELLLIGSGPGEASLRKLAHDLGVADRVILTGAVGQDEIMQHYAAATVFCSSSFSEGVPVVLMEAMASGCPVVATAIAGVRELVRHGETGMVVSPGRVDELAEAIALLVQDAGLRQRLADAGRSFVAREFDVRKSALELERFFQQMLGTTPMSGEPWSLGPPHGQAVALIGQ
jgi:glycosyltransferase involved in cell wall biosynthesis